jgi:hypothetical protein
MISDEVVLFMNLALSPLRLILLLEQTPLNQDNRKMLGAQAAELAHLSASLPGKGFIRRTRHSGARQIGRSCFWVRIPQ